MELKFRAWHKFMEVYYEVIAINFEYKNITIEDNGQRMEICLDNFIIEQYTGRKDYYGNEIYVGDIALYTYSDEMGSEHDYVEMDMREVWFYSSLFLKGNIHENKELLND